MTSWCAVYVGCVVLVRGVLPTRGVSIPRTTTTTHVRPIRVPGEVVPFAEFRAAAFAGDDRCDVRRRDDVVDLVHQRMADGGAMLVAVAEQDDDERDGAQQQEDFMATPPASSAADDAQRGAAAGDDPVFSTVAWSRFAALRALAEKAGGARPSLDCATLFEQPLGPTSKMVGIMEVSTQEMTLPTHSLTPDEGVYCLALAVHPRRRRAGIATRLLEAAEDVAREKNAAALLLHVEKANAGAIDFYEARDFARASGNDRRYRQFAIALGFDPSSHILFSRPVPPVVRR